MVAPFVIRRRYCIILQPWPVTDPPAPAKWHTLCPPLSILFILGAVNPADDAAVMRKGVLLQLRNDFLTVARSHQRYFGMRCQPSDQLRRAGFWNIHFRDNQIEYPWWRRFFRKPSSSTDVKNPPLTLLTPYRFMYSITFWFSWSSPPR